MDTSGSSLRTHTCGELRAEHAGADATLAGWVDSTRRHGEGLIFIDLRDRFGVTQIVADGDDCSPETLATADGLHGEDVIAVTGPVRRRDGGANPRLATGEIELVARQIRVLNRADHPPFFPTDKDSLPNEELRLRHRALDLRRPPMQRLLALRSRVAQTMRRHLDARGFLEVETPNLCKSTPEGARDFLVPSRLQPGEFYALPQSPQIFKQILMIAGVDRYFQIARCFRDEDPRADRQAEFTQLDLEMSFVRRDDVIALVSDLFREIWRDAAGVDLGDIPVMPYAEALSRFGTDRPDTRFGLELADVSEIVASTGFRVFTGALDAGGVVKAIRVPAGGASLTRKQIDGYAEFVKQFGAGGLPYVKLEQGAFATGVAKFLEPAREALAAALDLEDGDLVVFGADTAKIVHRALGELRLKLARDLNLIPPHGERWDFLWVVDFPLLEYIEELGRWDSLHHPFTAPKPEQAPLLDTDPAAVISDAYDLVVNGSEVAGGSVRIHSPALQERVFGLLGIGPDEARAKFGFLLDALRHGAPPHGGIAVGLDRVVMHLGGTDNIRDVIAFPKTQTGADLMSGAPSAVDPAQLDELHIALKPADRRG
ncbi:MAG: aspartate--tRNA ligase [Planctomycetota bacterium]|nr:MAG: aspartate--tRNA ligase [Planctomycetota bacterium]